MPNYRRAHQPGGTFFLTLVTHLRHPLFADETARLVLRHSISQTRHERPFTLDAIVLLPDHLHLILTLPDCESDFSTRVGAIKGRFSRRWHERRGVELPQSVSRQKHEQRGVWQKRFWEHCVSDEADLNRCIEYMMYNPVKHGLARCPHAWPHSSFAQFVDQHRFAQDWYCACGGAAEAFCVDIPGAEADS
jgi:putative transposase